MRILAVFLCALWLAGCGESKKPAQPGHAAAVPIGPAPEVFQVKFETSKGDFVLEAAKAWAPRGAERFYELVRRGYFDGDRFFRVLRGFIVQWGLNGDPSVSVLWQNSYIADDPVKKSNRRSYVSFAKREANTRTTQVFINLKDNAAMLDGMGFAPFGKITTGMDVVDRFWSSYGDGPPRGAGPDQRLIHTQGKPYLEDKFPRLDYIKKATVM